MADTRISEETAASALGGTEVTEGVQGGANVKITATQIKTFANASPTITGHATIEGVTATGATGTGKLVFDGTPTLVTPVLGVATGTSLALNGATLGANKLAVMGTTLLTGAITGTSSLTLGVASSATGSLILANTGSAFATTIQAGNNAAARTYIWPTNFGAAGTVLTDASGDGTLSWGAIPSGTITANSTLTSGLTAGQLLYSDATKIQASAGLTVAANSLTIGTASSATGSLVLLNSGGAFTTTLQASASTAASRTYILPVNFGASGSILTDSAGNGVLSWATAPAAALTVGSTAISSGTTTRILYDNAGTLGEYTTTGSGTEVALSTSPTFITGLTSPVVTLGAQQTTQGSLVLANTAAGAFATTIKSSNSATAAVTYTLPPAGATVAGQVLTDAAANGVLSWAAPPSGGLTVGTTTITSGTTTRLLYDLAGVVQESVGGTWNATAQALTIASIADPASSTLTLTGGTALTTSQPVLNATQTWNAAGTAFTGLKFNVTNTASAAGSLLMDLQVGSSTVFNISKSGVATNVQTIAGVSTDGLVLQNPATAISGTAQWSPRIRFTGSLYHSGGTPGAAITDWIIENKTPQSTAGNSDYNNILQFSTQTAGGGYNAIMYLSNVNSAGPYGGIGLGAFTSGVLQQGFLWNSSDIVTNVGGSGAFSVRAASARVLAASTIGWVAGTDVTALPDTMLSRGGAAANIQLGGADGATIVAQTLRVQSVVAGTANGTAGADWVLKASSGTGTGVAGNIIFQTPFSAKTTGTGQGTWVDRAIIVSKGKVLTSTAAYSLCDIALPSLAMCGGVIEATIVCTDGSEMQSFTQTITYSAINKGDVYTSSITASTGDKSVSGGSTLTTVWSIATGTSKITIQVTPTTSLTPSTNSFLLYFRINNHSEKATTIL